MSNRSPFVVGKPVEVDSEDEEAGVQRTLATSKVMKPTKDLIVKREDILTSNSVVDVDEASGQRKFGLGPR
jgi:hypothetical protein